MPSFSGTQILSRIPLPFFPRSRPSPDRPGAAGRTSPGPSRTVWARRRRRECGLRGMLGTERLPAASSGDALRLGNLPPSPLLGHCEALLPIGRFEPLSETVAMVIDAPAFLRYGGVRFSMEGSKPPTDARKSATHVADSSLAHSRFGAPAERLGLRSGQQLHPDCYAPITFAGG